MDWKEQFDKKFAGIKRGGFEYPLNYELKSFISTEIIEKLIADIPDSISYDAGTMEEDITWLKQQLKDKWLN